MANHRFEVAVGVQKRMAARDAKRPNDYVGGFSHRDAKGAQSPIVCRRFDRDFIVEQGSERKPAQPTLQAIRVGVVLRALQDFQQNEIAKENDLFRGEGLKFQRLRICAPAQMRDPDGAVDEDQAARGFGARRIFAKSPSQPMPLSSASALD